MALPLLTLLGRINCLDSWVFGLHRSRQLQACQDKRHVRNGNRRLLCLVMNLWQNCAVLVLAAMALVGVQT